MTERDESEALGNGAPPGLVVLETCRMPVDDLRLFERNPRQGDVGAIVTSLRVNGQYRALVVNRRDMRVLAGNHTLLALRELGAADALVHLVDVDDEQATRIVLADNRTNDLAAYDDTVLIELLAGLNGDLGGTGWDQSSIDELLAVDDWDAAVDGLSGESPEYHQVSFHLTEGQAETVRRAVNYASTLGPFDGAANPNANGNALARVAETYLTQNGG
jgi:hypothetical protein